MAITVKKRKVTVKTVKSKAKLDVAPESVEPAEVQPDSQPVAVQPQNVGGPVRVDSHKYTYAVVFAIIAILMFIGLIALQSLELSFYYQPRPVFLRKVSVTAMPSAPIATPPPASSDAE